MIQQLIIRNRTAQRNFVPSKEKKKKKKKKKKMQPITIPPCPSLALTLIFVHTSDVLVHCFCTPSSLVFISMHSFCLTSRSSATYYNAFVLYKQRPHHGRIYFSFRLIPHQSEHDNSVRALARVCRVGGTGNVVSRIVADVMIND